MAYKAEHSHESPFVSLRRAAGETLKKIKPQSKSKITKSPIELHQGLHPALVANELLGCDVKIDWLTIPDDKLSQAELKPGIFAVGTIVALPKETVRSQIYAIEELCGELSRLSLAVAFKCPGTDKVKEIRQLAWLDIPEGPDVLNEDQSSIGVVCVGQVPDIEQKIQLGVSVPDEQLFYGIPDARRIDTNVPLREIPDRYGPMQLV